MPVADRQEEVPPKTLDPGEIPKGNLSARVLLHQAAKANASFGDYIDALFTRFKAKDSLDFAMQVNERLQIIDPDETGQLSFVSVEKFRKDQYRSESRGPIEQVELLCKAFSLDNADQRLIWRMMMGSPITIANYDALVQRVESEKNPAILTEGLLAASGLPTNVLKASGIFHIDRSLKGQKFPSSNKARLFMQLVFPAVAITGEKEDPEILARHESAVKLLADATALPPIMFETLTGKRTAREILEATIQKAGEEKAATFQEFLHTLMREWDVTPGQLLEIVAYNYQTETGSTDSLGESTFRDLLKIPPQGERLNPQPGTIEVLRMGLELDEQDEMRMWRLMRGHDITKTLPDLIEAATQTGDTGPLVTELVTASGIPPMHLMRIIPYTKLYEEWMAGGFFEGRPIGKISDPLKARRLLDLVYPVKPFSADLPDETRIAQRDRMLELLAYKRYMRPGVREKQRERLAGRTAKAREDMDRAVADMPLGDLLEDAYKNNLEWKDIVTLALEAWDASAPDWSNYVQRKNPSGKTISVSSIYDWQSNPEVEAVSSPSVDLIKTAHDLNELQESIIYKSKNGRRLNPGDTGEYL